MALGNATPLSLELEKQLCSLIAFIILVCARRMDGFVKAGQVFITVLNRVIELLPVERAKSDGVIESEDIGFWLKEVGCAAMVNYLQFVQSSCIYGLPVSLVGFIISPVGGRYLSNQSRPFLL